MSLSEAAAMAMIERGVEAGMSQREAAMWREAVRSPCGCSEGLAAGGLLAFGTSRAGGPRRAQIFAFVAGAGLGKVIGIMRQFPLVRFQRNELQRRVEALAAAAPHDH